MNRLDRLFQEWRLYDEGEEQPRFSLAVSRAFPLEGISRTVVSKEDETFLELVFPGLYGPFGILPDYFTDELQLEGRDREAMRRFLDIFNNRLLQIMFQAWRRYRFFTDSPLEPKTGQAEREAILLNRLAGLMAEPRDPLFLRGLRWHKIGLYRRSVRTASGLLELLRTFFPELRIELHSFVAVYRAIPQHQFSKLGENISLGSEGNFLVGERIKDIAGGFRLMFRSLDYQSFMNLSPGGCWRESLARLVRDFTRGQPACFVRLELEAAQVPAWRLGDRRLGLNMWLKSRPMDRPVTVEAGGLS